MKSSLSQIRLDYKKHTLNISDIDESPSVQFSVWLEEALKSEVMEPTAMTLSTVSEQGQPSSRIVLLKYVDEIDFVFFTNYDSRKGKELLSNNKASLLFFWPELERQVRIEGSIAKSSAQISDTYFNERPYKSRVAAIVSPQSHVISSREVLDANYEKAIAGTEKEIRRPENWGGYMLRAHYFEFWQGRENRLHDRFEYKLQEHNWVVNRLAP